ncbi:MAG: SDR family oxidoreductase, partial [Pseudomonadota bacterium]|nr:SDR family oxidoreductase [Pseudomonadota bacterium]
VKGFAKAGWHTIIHYRSSSDPAQELADTLPSAETVKCDLSDGDAAEAMIQQLLVERPDLRCLVNSASVFDYDSATKLDPATNREAMQVNATSPARMAQAFLRPPAGPDVRSVIQITDMKLRNTNPDFFSYTMSKHAHASTIGMLAKHYANDAAKRIYGIAPGAILASHDQTEDETDTSHRLNLLGRKTGPEEIVDAALFLSQGVLKSGSTLYIDSGQHLLSQPRDVIYLAREQEEAAG